MLNGVLLVDKPAGPTSHDIVNTVRRLFRQRRVGHTGTLDPAATGLLVVLLGKATRLAGWTAAGDKEYSGLARFGTATDTLDADGRVTETRACDFTEAELAAGVARLTGEIKQLPPQYSAVKVNGRPAYSLARAGVEAALKERTVTIKDFKAELVEEGESPLVRFSLACSGGTYIRSVVRDLGALLDCPAHLSHLRRTRVGGFTVEQAVDLERIETAEPAERQRLLLPLGAGVELPVVSVVPEEFPALLNGRAVRIARYGAIEGSAPGAAEPPDGEEVKIVATGKEDLIALGRIEGDTVKPFLVLASPVMV